MNIFWWLVHDIEQALQKLRFITNKIASTSQRRKKFRKCAMEKYFKNLNSDPDRRQSLAVVRDVRTRWNYTHAMIRRAELLQEVSLLFIRSEYPADSLLLISTRLLTTGFLKRLVSVCCCWASTTGRFWKTLQTFLRYVRYKLTAYCSFNDLIRFIALHRSHITNVAQQSSNNFVCLTVISQNGATSRGSREFLKFFIQDSTCCWKRPCEAEKI